MQRQTSPGRQGKKLIGAYVTLDEWRELRDVATVTERTQDDLIKEALGLLIEKYRPQTQPTRNGKNTPRRDKPARELTHK